jgi:hypothetical protein
MRHELILSPFRSDVNYFVDDWGFHAVNKYSNQGPHSRVSGHFALGYEAVQALHSDGQPKSAELTLKQDLGEHAHFSNSSIFKIFSNL